MYATGADSGIFRAYAQPGVKQTPWAVLANEAVAQGQSTLQIIAFHPEAVALGAAESLIQWASRPYATVSSWFSNSGNTLGETAASFTASAQLGINALYGQDVGAQVQTRQALSSALVASQVAGIGNLAGGATRAAAGMLERTVAKAAVATEAAVANSEAEALNVGGRQPLAGPTAN